MSPDAPSREAPSREVPSREAGAPDAAGRKATARGFRLAFGVAASLLVEALRGADLPSLAPLIALQLLTLSPRPPGGRMVGLLFGAAALSSLAAWVITAVTVSIPGAYPLGMGVLYLWGFALSLTPRTAPLGAMALTMTIVVGSLSAVSTGAAAGVGLSLALSVLSGGAMVYLAFALFPVPASAPAGPPPPAASGAAERLPVPLRAGLATLAILPLHMWLTSDGVAAMAVLFTCSSMLRQPGVEASLRDSLDRLAGAAAGGLVALAADGVAALHDAAALILALVAAAALFFAWRIVGGPRRAAVWTPGFVTFVALYGMTLSPTLGGGEVEALTRVLQVAAGALYTLCAVSLLVPPARRLMRRRPTPAPRRA
ncbi:MAG: FUSC family protein [Pseudomonadota bacterium]|nr:FUSC family protein [Pseudomonadota bacterium]